MNRRNYSFRAVFEGGILPPCEEYPMIHHLRQLDGLSIASLAIFAAYVAAVFLL
jgi:hypothetical protein